MVRRLETYFHLTYTQTTSLPNNMCAHFLVSVEWARHIQHPKFHVGPFFYVLIRPAHVALCCHPNWVGGRGASDHKRLHFSWFVTSCGHPTIYVSTKNTTLEIEGNCIFCHFVFLHLRPSTVCGRTKHMPCPESPWRQHAKAQKLTDRPKLTRTENRVKHVETCKTCCFFFSQYYCSWFNIHFELKFGRFSGQCNTLSRFVAFKCM